MKHVRKARRIHTDNTRKKVEAQKKIISLLKGRNLAGMAAELRKLEEEWTSVDYGAVEATLMASYTGRQAQPLGLSESLRSIASLFARRETTPGVSSVPSITFDVAPIRFGEDEGFSEELITRLRSRANNSSYTETDGQKMHRLKVDAQMSYLHRGHPVTLWQDMSSTVSQMVCPNCSKWVMVNVRPGPNDIEVSGTAVALGCYDDPD